MDQFWVWITEHWFLGFLLIYASIHGGVILISRFFIRLPMVLFRGWPPKYLDADGDPAKEDSSQKDTVTITGKSGPLSEENPGYITVYDSDSPGGVKKLILTKDVEIEI